MSCNTTLIWIARNEVLVTYWNAENLNFDMKLQQFHLKIKTLIEKFYSLFTEVCTTVLYQLSKMRGKDHNELLKINALSF